MPEAAPATPLASPKKKTKRKKLMIMIGSGVGLVLLVIGGYAYMKLTEPPPPPMPKLKRVAAKPAPDGSKPTPDATKPAGTATVAKPAAAKPAEGKPSDAKPTDTKPAATTTTAKQTVEKLKQEQMAPLNEVVETERPTKSAPNLAAPAGNVAEPAIGTPDAAAQAATEAQAAARPEVRTTPPPPPPPSLAFKAWVQNLRISGVRGGERPKVFIEHTAYSPGDMVNPGLGITFEAYDSNTHNLIFRDKSGAVVERHN